MNRARHTPTVAELSALVACARLGTAAAAAETLGLTPSAVSRSIRGLEDRLGVALFARRRQRLVLSDAGRALVRDAEAILGQIDASARMVMAFGGSGAVLRLAVLPTFAAAWLIPRLADFARIAPEVSLDLTAELGPVDFDAGPFDAAIQRADLARPGTVVTPLAAERLVVVAAPALAGAGLLDPAAVARLPLIQQSTRPRLWADWFAAAGAVPEPAHPRGPRFAQFGMILAAARAGMGAAILPDIFVAEALADGSLALLSQTALPGPSPYALIRPDREPGPALARLAAWLETGAPG